MKSISVLLIFSFIATIIGFTVAYTENKNYRALTEKYDQALERVSDLEVSVSALMSAESSSSADTIPSYSAEDTPDIITETQSENSDYTEHSTENTVSESSTQMSENTDEVEPSTAQATSDTYYVTQSGKKYHTASCSYLSKSKIAITMDRIKSEGYSPCSRCIK